MQVIEAPQIGLQRSKLVRRSHPGSGPMISRASRQSCGRSGRNKSPGSRRRVRSWAALVSPLEGRVADTEWKPLPAGLWTLPAVFMEAGNLLLEAFMEAGVLTWKVREKTSNPLKWNMIAEGTADSPSRRLKAAALYEAETALRKP